MGDSPATRPSLLVRLRDPRDSSAWSLFVDLYAPLIHGFARKRGLQDADAADLTQDVLRRVAQGIRKLDYDPERGSFRGWLFTIVRNHLRNVLSRGDRFAQGSGDTAVEQLLQAQAAPEPDEEEEWNRDHQRRLLAWAADQVRRSVSETAWQAFYQSSIEGKESKDVARSLGMSIAAVYMARSRVRARLKELIEQVQDDFPFPDGDHDA
jgi:RNA polymerase sigma-70 factor (ECF subfamily)